ncbi:hypothetical protein HYDPIDRAFT_139854 [Hydnomerulius pinastri MD-312]|uniref:Cytochrome P450 n=1 Tax=Hydnomerulius pinastri MD-312 TaxID=994086 RepID=A0A0C9V3Y2_9AGAM|nr:hypothetical protein HYDPIDRAFT_139854 [Hydnomerulius pinastri MD-312]
MDPKIFFDVCLAGAGLYLASRVFRKKTSQPLPPGPAGWPLIGNLLEFPTHGAWLTFADLSKKYGDIISMNVLGSQMIILNSAKTVTDFLEKKSAISSDRPHLTMACDLVGWKELLIFQQYGERFRQYRKFFHRQLGSRNSLATFYPVEEDETRQFLCNVLQDPDDLAAHIRRTAGAIILKISHGYNVKGGDDPFVELADKSMANFSLVATPGAFLVDHVPVLRHLPEWFPGAGFLRDAKQWRKLVTETATKPHEFVLEQLAKGNTVPSFTSRLLEEGVTPEEEDILMWASFSMYLGGSDTTVSTIYAFFLAMTIHPEVLKTAQAELDAIIGTERLPTFEDRDSLPYVNAICKEVLRWNVVAPLAMPHVTTQDEIFEGYFIPKGSMVSANIWYILHNEDTYPEPEVFRPERFLGDNVQPDPRDACFGYGRRICPGLHLADASIFISIAMSLATLNISRYVENGVEVVPKLEHLEGVVCHPLPFKCRITPRSPKTRTLLQS